MRWSDRRARARVFVPRPIRLHSRSEEQQDKHLSLRLDASRDAVEITMTYEGIEYAIRAGLGRNEWVLLISFPDNVGGNPSVVNFSGARNDAIAEAKKRIDNWLKRLEKKKNLAALALVQVRGEIPSIRRRTIGRDSAHRPLQVR